MSRYTDINRLLDEIGTSGRSANDPWTLSGRASGEVRRGSFAPAVIADFGAPVDGLTSDIRSSEHITQAEIAQGTSGASDNTQSSSGGGFLGGLLNKIFPFASGIAKLFGFGDSDPAPAPVPYGMPPSINFEGAVSGAGSGVTSLSYGSNGLPRVSNAAPAANFTSNAAAEIGQLTPASSAFVPSPSPASQNSLATPIPQAGVADAPPDSSASFSSLPPESSAPPPNAQQSHNILVQVQAMDSQSFMDHSHDIAQAVRQAMLNMNSLNDVIQDL